MILFYNENLAFRFSIDFQTVESVQLFSMFIISVDFGGQSCVVIGFFVSSGALLVGNVSFLTPLYLGKNYAH